MNVPDISIILPAYNEARTIVQTTREIAQYFAQRRLCCEIIVAADGNDGTRELVREMSQENPAIRAIGHPERSGKGRGIREAVEIASGAIVAYMDADNKVPIEEFAAVEPWLKQFPVVVGSRAMKQSVIERKQSWYRQIGGRGFHYFMRLVVGLKGVHDTQCGFKFFHAEAARRIFRAQKIDAYMFDVEILVLAQRFGYAIKEVPVRWRDDGDSRLNLLSGNARNVVDIFKIAAGRRRRLE